jgi:UDP-3-O-[3-hydroxymyristoyl] glucosamine N-acyltransferase
MNVTLGELAVRFGCELRGDPEAVVDSVGALSHAGPRAVTFLANPKLASRLKDSRAGAVILDARSAGESPVATLVVDNPHVTYARIAQLLHPDPPLAPGVHPTAVVAAGASIDPSAEIGPHVTVGERVVIGARAYIGPGTVIEHDAVVGADTRLVARAFLGHHVKIGARAVVQPGAVIGAEGFGFANDRGAWVKVPQVGSVIVGDDVEIGCNTTIDRGAIEDTVIEDGVKLDNLIMVAHNCRIGMHTAIAALTGLAGSTTLGKRCYVGGEVGFTGHLSVCDDAVILGKSLIAHSINKPGVYSSALPAEEAGTWRRIVGRIKRLDSMAKRLRAVEKHVGFSPADTDHSED